MRLRLHSAKINVLKSCEIQFQAHFVNGGKRRFFHYEKKVRNYGHEFAKINLHIIIFVVSLIRLENSRVLPS